MRRESTRFAVSVLIAVVIFSIVAKCSLPIHAQAGAASSSPAQSSASSSANQKPSGFAVHGTASARAVFYQASGLAARRSPFSYILSGLITPSLGDFSLPVAFNYTEQDRTFAQPLNTFSIAPTYQWITLRGGFFNPNYNPYTLGGHQILGASLELTPGNFRFGASYGQFLRPVQPNAASAFVLVPTYARSGLAAHIGYGDQTNFIEFSALKAQDDTTSLPPTTSIFDSAPSENLAAGMSTRFSLFNNALTFRANVGVSAFTRDRRLRTPEGALVAAVPGRGVFNALSTLFTTNLSTQIYTALDASLLLTLTDFSAGVNVLRVDPDFRSMGVYFINNDIQRIDGTVSIALFNQVVNISALVGVQSDNLQNKKIATTRRIVPSVVVAINPSPSFGIDLTYTDMITTQTDGRVRVSDSTRMNMQNPMIGIAPRIMLQGSSSLHSITANASYQRLLDNNRFTSEFTQYTALNATLGYSLTFLYDALTIGAGVNATRLDGFGGQFVSNGASLTLSKTFDGAFTLSGTGAYSLQQTFTGQNANVLNANVQASYRVGIHTIGLNAFYTSNAVSAAPNSSFTELNGVLSYAITF